MHGVEGSPIVSADQCEGSPTRGAIAACRLPLAAGVEPLLATLLWAIESARHAALHDPLTGLANRSLILDHLQIALARAERGATLAAVIFFDLDNFKPVNDTLGHVAGDELLVRIAERVRPTLRPADTLGRWGGDEFVVVCEDLEHASDASSVAERIGAAFERPFDVQGTQLQVSASIGVAISAGTDQPATLIHAADSAMYRAKRAPARHPERDAPWVFVGVAGAAKHERLTARLLDLLASVEIDDAPVPGQAAQAAGA